MATIAENLQTIIDIKADIKTAIENKGVTVGDSSFTDYPTLINNIPQENTGGGTPTKIDVAATGIKFGNSTFTEIPDIFDFDGGIIDMSYMYYNCRKLTSISPLNSSNVLNMNWMCNGCESLTILPQFNTAKVSEMAYFLGNCFSLQSVPLLECGNVVNMNEFMGWYTLTTLTHLGGFKDLKVSITSGFLNNCPNLTVESLMNVINNVYDLTANGLSGQSLKFGSTNLNKLTAEQIAVATAKGWTLTS